MYYLKFVLLFIFTFIWGIVFDYNAFLDLVFCTPIVLLDEKYSLKSISPYLALLGLFALSALGTTLLTDYLDYPWFQTDTYTCDGPCFGWYYFEYTLNSELLYLLIVQVIAILILLSIRVLLALVNYLRS